MRRSQTMPSHTVSKDRILNCVPALQSEQTWYRRSRVGNCQLNLEVFDAHVSLVESQIRSGGMKYALLNDRCKMTSLSYSA